MKTRTIKSTILIGVLVSSLGCAHRFALETVSGFRGGEDHDFVQPVVFALRGKVPGFILEQKAKVRIITLPSRENYQVLLGDIDGIRLVWSSLKEDRPMILGPRDAVQAVILGHEEEVAIINGHMDDYSIIYGVEDQIQVITGHMDDY